MSWISSNFPKRKGEEKSSFQPDQQIELAHPKATWSSAMTVEEANLETACEICRAVEFIWYTLVTLKQHELQDNVTITAI